MPIGLLGVLSAKQMGVERIIAMGRHDSQQKLAGEFGATDIVTERSDEGVARVKDLTKGIGTDAGDPFHAPRAGPWATSESPMVSSFKSETVLRPRLPARSPAQCAVFCPS